MALRLWLWQKPLSCAQLALDAQQECIVCIKKSERRLLSRSRLRSKPVHL